MRRGCRSLEWGAERAWGMIVKTKMMWLAGVALALTMPAEAKDQTGAKIALGVLVVALLATPVICFMLAARARAKAARAQSWPSVQGTVTAVSVAGHRSGSKRAWSSSATRSRNAYFVPHIAYRFSVMGREFTGKRLRFGPVSSRNEDEAAAMVAGYQVDGPIVVHHDPQNPADNVVKPEAYTKNLTFMAWIFIAMDVVFAGVAAAALLGKG